MPRTVIDYSKCIIYKIVCKDLNETYCYVGHTTNFTRRKNSHKNCCINVNNKNYDMKVYQKIRETGGWDNYEMIVIDEYKDCQNSNQARTKEREWIEKIANLNKSLPLRTNKESCAKYKAEHPEKIKEINAKYRMKNLEKIKESRVKNYAKNSDNIKEQTAKYYDENKERISEKRKEKVECVCGSIVTKWHIKRHEKSKNILHSLMNKKPKSIT